MQERSPRTASGSQAVNPLCWELLLRTWPPSPSSQGASQGSGEGPRRRPFPPPPCSQEVLGLLGSRHESICIPHVWRQPPGLPRGPAQCVCGLCREPPLGVLSIHQSGHFTAARGRAAANAAFTIRERQRDVSGCGCRRQPGPRRSPPICDWLCGLGVWT